MQKAISKYWPIFVLPTLVAFIIGFIWPFIWGVYLSFQRFTTVSKTTSRIYDILHANGIIRIDYIISKDKDGKDKVNMLEINTTPGMTVTSFIPQQVRAAGLDIKDVLSEIVENQF
jgi:D-alanine-D-alanine ligase